MIKKCEFCKKIFETQINEKKFCEISCRKKAYYQRHKLEIKLKNEMNKEHIASVQMKYDKDHWFELLELKRKKYEAFHNKLYTNKQCKYCNGVNRLSYHHIDPSTKKYSVSSMLHKSDKLVEEEIKKCILLCAACHLALHRSLKN